METSGFIDVRKLIRELSVEELCATADEYYRKIENFDYYFAKPFGELSEVGDVLIAFGHVLKGMRLVPGMQVLDFGAGTCWSTRYLAQLGLEAIALDVSDTALRIGEELFRR